jgi:uncharacterized protein (TIGR02284 family)
VSTPTSTNEHCIEICNNLLRGERSAVEAYDKAIDKFGSKQDLADLAHIRDEHRWAVSRLENNVRQMGGTPAQESGAWGTFVNAVQATANLFGADSAIHSLQQGEKKGRSDYSDALQDKNVLPECKTMIERELLPKIEAQLERLDRLEEVA